MGGFSQSSKLLNSYSPFMDHNVVPPPFNPQYRPIDTHFVGAVVPEVESIQNTAIDKIDELDNHGMMSNRVREKHVRSILIRSRLESITACCDKAIECYYTNRSANYNARKNLPLRYRNMGGKVEYEHEDFHFGEVRGALAMATREWSELRSCEIENQKPIMNFILHEAHLDTESISHHVNALVKAFVSLDSMKGISKTLKSPNWLYRQGNEIRKDSPFDIPDLQNFAKALHGALRTPVKVKTKKWSRRLTLYRFITLDKEIVDGFWSICNREMGDSSVHNTSSRSIGDQSQSLLDGSFQHSEHCSEGVRSALSQTLQKLEKMDDPKILAAHEKSLQGTLHHAMKSVSEAHLPDLTHMLDIISRLPWSEHHASQYTQYVQQIFLKIRGILSENEGKSVKYHKVKNEHASGLPVVQEWEKAFHDDGISKEASIKKDPYCFFPKRLFYQGNYSVRYAQPHNVLKLTDVLIRLRTRLEAQKLSEYTRATLSESSLMYDTIINYFPSKACMSSQFSGTTASSGMRDICAVLFSLCALPEVELQRIFSSAREKELLYRLEYMFTASLSNTDRNAESILSIPPPKSILYLQDILPIQEVQKKVHCLCGCLYAFVRLNHIPSGLSNVFAALIPTIPALGTYSILLLLRTIANLRTILGKTNMDASASLLLNIIAQRLIDSTRSEKRKGRALRAPLHRPLFTAKNTVCELVQLADDIGEVKLQEAALVAVRALRRTQRISKPRKYSAKTKRMQNASMSRPMFFVALHHLIARSNIPVQFQNAGDRSTRETNTTNLMSKVDIACIDKLSSAVAQSLNKKMLIHMTWSIAATLLPAFMRLLLSTVSVITEMIAQGTQHSASDTQVKIEWAQRSLLKPVISLSSYVSSHVDALGGHDFDVRSPVYAQIVPHFLQILQSPLAQHPKGASFLRDMDEALKEFLKGMGCGLKAFYEKCGTDSLLRRERFSPIFDLLVSIGDVPKGFLPKEVKLSAAHILLHKLKSLQSEIEKSKVHDRDALQQELMQILAVSSNIDCLKDIETGLAG